MKDTTAKGPWTALEELCVYRNVMYWKCAVDIPKQFVEHADKAVKGITYFYLLAEDVLIEPDNIEASPRVKDTLHIHMIKWFFDEQNVPYLQFFKMATDEKPFFTQFYGEEACGHQKTAADDNHRYSCHEDYEPTEEWPQCSICKVWSHSNCFFG